MTGLHHTGRRRIKRALNMSGGKIERDAEGREGSTSLALTRAQWAIAVPLVYAAVALTVLEYFARPDFYARYFPVASRELFGLYPHLWWAGCTITLFLLVPAAIVKFGFRKPLREYGLNLQIRRRHLGLYLLMFAAVLPLVFVAAARPEFQATYPFYRGAFQAGIGAIALWELAYLSQFVALEFFFRGFLVLGLSRLLGRAAIWVAVVPYCMIHFHKPPLEAFAAIVAGLVLGEVAWRTRSILGGVIVHVGVAASMEWLALAAAGRI